MPSQLYRKVIKACILLSDTHGNVCIYQANAVMLSQHSMRQTGQVVYVGYLTHQAIKHSVCSQLVACRHNGKKHMDHFMTVQIHAYKYLN